MTKTRRIIFIALFTVVISLGLPFIYYKITEFEPYGWDYARAMAGTIGTMLGDYAKSEGSNGNYPPSWEELLELYPDLKNVKDIFDKKLAFQEDCFSWKASYDETLEPPIRFIITVTAPKKLKDEHLSMYKKITYDHNQVFKEYRD